MPTNYLLGDPLLQNAQDVISQRLFGEGVGLDPAALQQQLDFVNSGIQQDRQAQEMALMDRLSAMGSSRGGFAAASQRGIGESAGRSMAQAGTQMKLEQETRRQQAIMDAMQRAMQWGDLGLRNRELDQQQQVIDFQNQEPGFLQLLGQGLGLGASLFGAGGAFPNFFGLTGGGQQDDLNNLLMRMAQNSGARYSTASLPNYAPIGRGYAPGYGL